MAKGSINFGKVSIDRASILSVEKGNYNPTRDPKGTVIAFSVSVAGYEKAVKVIVKDELAVVLYNGFLGQGGTVDKVMESDFKNINVVRETVVTFEADIKEEQEKVLLLRNPENIVLDFKYTVVQG